MKVLDPGHLYELHMLDGPGTVPLRFVKRQGVKYPGNDSSYPGTNIQEVVRCLIDRLRYLEQQEPDWTNRINIVFLQQVLSLLERRAARKHRREWIPKFEDIETAPFCGICGHIGCDNH